MDLNNLVWTDFYIILDYLPSAQIKLINIMSIRYVVPII